MSLTRFYLTSAAAPVSAVSDPGWEDTTQVTRGLLSLTKSGTNAAITATETNVASGRDTLVGQWVSAPMTHGGVLSGAFQGVFAQLESDAAADLSTRYAIYVVTNSGSSIVASFGFVNSAEWPTATTGGSVALTLSPITCQAGNRLVIEVGFKANNTVTTSYTGTIRRGGTDPTDLVVGDTGTAATTRSPWFEFSNSEVEYLFTSTKGVAAWPGTINGTLLVEAAWGAVPTTDPTTWTWTDISADVRYRSGIDISWGRGDEASSAQPATATLTLDNRTGAYSLGPQSANYPNVRRGTPIRVRVDAGGGWATQFQGTAGSWQPQFDRSGRDATVVLTAGGMLRQLSQGRAPLSSPFRRKFTADIAVANSDVIAYWPCEDLAGADRLENLVAADRSIYPTGARPELGSIDAFRCSAPILRLGATRLVGAVGPFTHLSPAETSVSFLAVIPSNLPNNAVLARLTLTGGGVGSVDVVYGTGGTLDVRAYTPARVLISAAGFAAFDVDDQALRFDVRLIADGSDVEVYLTNRHPGDRRIPFLFADCPGVSLGKLSAVEIAPDANCEGMGVGHILAQRNVGVVGPDGDEYNAFRPENASTRLARLCAENDVELEVRGVVSSADMGYQSIASLIDLLGECETVDLGRLSDGRGPGLLYITGNTVGYQPAPKLTAAAAAGELTPEMGPVDDDQHIRNRVIATRPYGSQAIVSDDTGPLGTATVGVYEEQVSVNVVDDATLADHASWRVHLGTTEGYRYPTLPLALHHDPGLASGWAKVVAGDRVDVTGLSTVRPQLPDEGTQRFVVEGAQQRLTNLTWDVVATVSSYEPTRVGLTALDTGDLDENALRCDTDGSVLASGATLGATSLSVSTPSGPLWTTAADDYPLVVEIAGTPVTVTAVSGASSPQTFTVNATARALAAGAAVALYRPAVLGAGS